jgi:copper homeostasis protein
VTPRVAIIGAGLAGLAAADRLLRRGLEVTLIDKGRHVGGRFCTRAVRRDDNTTAKFDLGPQALYARRSGDSRGRPERRARDLFDHLVPDQPVVARDIGRICGPDEPYAPAAPVGMTIPGGMRELAFHMLSMHRETIDFRDHTLAERLTHTDDGWRIETRSLRDESRASVIAQALILTAPLPQALELLAACRVALPDDLATQLRRVEYRRQIALYGVFAGAERLPDGGIWCGDGPLEWIVDNRGKGVTDVENAFTVLTSHDWAEEHWAEPDPRLIARLLPIVHAWVGDPMPGTQPELQRWKWAMPVKPVAAPCAVVRDLALVLAGDGFSGTLPDPADAALASGESAGSRAAGLITALARADDRFTTARPSRVTLEVAVTTPDEALRAQQAGADRLELSSGLEVGGLTPSLGLFREVRKVVKLPIYVLIRPRPGGFCYTTREFGTMLRDARRFMRAGAAGLVFGILKEDGEIHRTRCADLVWIAGKRAVFHRAFDLLADQFLALDVLIDLEFERVLTSGGGSTAEAGATRLSALVQHAGWEIGVLPAGGIRPENVADLVRETRCDQVHTSARVPVDDPLLAANPRLASALGGNPSGNRTATSADVVAAMRAELNRVALSVSSAV